MKTLLFTLILLPCLAFADPIYEQNSQGLIQPYQNDAYGPGVSSDATGRPFQWQTRQGQTVPPGTQVQPDGYGPGVGMDQYGRPVYPNARH